MLGKSLAASLPQAFDDFEELWIVGALVVVPKALLRVASCASDGEVVEVVGSTMVPRYDVLERRPVERCSVGPQRQLSLAMNALPLEDSLAIEHLRLEGSIARSHLEKQPLLSARSHTASIANMAPVNIHHRSRRLFDSGPSG